MSIDERLKQARDQAGLSKSQVARLTQSDVTRLNMLEDGTDTPTTTELTTLANLYKCSLDWLLTGALNMPKFMSGTNDDVRQLLGTLQYALRRPQHLVPESPQDFEAYSRACLALHVTQTAHENAAFWETFHVVGFHLIRGSLDAVLPGKLVSFWDITEGALDGITWEEVCAMPFKRRENPR